ncbi:MAG: TatD family hydrolase [Verrucomicrobia bacterium]|nr:TatD family hydrolase [Verrucomicrobiota bacterium]
MPITYTDTHAHLTSEQILPLLGDVLQRAKQSGVAKIVNICTGKKSLEEGLVLHESHPWVYNAAATTPHDVEKEGEEFFPLVERAAASKKLVALGETGLDYFYEHSDKKVQQKFLLRYFSLALQTKLPLIFHCRDAFPDLFAMADGHFQGAPAVLHCFTGTLEEAKGVLDRGWFLSLSGIVTFKKSESLREVAKYVPLDRLFIETDSPYLAPQSNRGKPNEPSYISETAETIAFAKGVSVGELAKATEDNAERFFSFSKVK